MDTPRPRPPVCGGNLLTKLIPVIGILLLYRIIEQGLAAMRSNPRTSFIAAVAASLTRHGQAASTVDLSWHAPNATGINNLTEVIGGAGVYGFVYNSSQTPAGQYGVYNWCNMPHVRATEYQKPGSEYKLQYVEVVSSSRSDGSGCCVDGIDSSPSQTYCLRFKLLPCGILWLGL